MRYREACKVKMGDRLFLRQTGDKIAVERISVRPSSVLIYGFPAAGDSFHCYEYRHTALSLVAPQRRRS